MAKYSPNSSETLGELKRNLGETLEKIVSYRPQGRRITL